MKKPFQYLFIVVSLLLNNISFSSAQVIVTNSVIDGVTRTYTSLFSALKRGDLRTIRLYLPPEEYARYKVLLEQNKEYPAFLRNFYAGAHFRLGKIDSVRTATDEVIAEFIVDFPSGETLNTRMKLSQDKTAGWKIKNILRDKTDQGEPDRYRPRSKSTLSFSKP